MRHVVFRLHIVFIHLSFACFWEGTIFIPCTCPVCIMQLFHFFRNYYENLSGIWIRVFFGTVAKNFGACTPKYPLHLHFFSSRFVPRFIPLEYPCLEGQFPGPFYPPDFTFFLMNWSYFFGKDAPTKLMAARCIRKGEQGWSETVRA